MKTRILFAFALVLALAGSAFRPHGEVSRSTDYAWFVYNGDPGDENNPELWEQVPSVSSLCSGGNTKLCGIQAPMLEESIHPDFSDVDDVNTSDVIRNKRFKP